MLMPDFPGSHSWADESIRNRIGVVAAMPLYELYYFWWGYLLVACGFAVVEPFIIRTHQQKLFALILGTVMATLIYCAYKVSHYSTASRIYEIHSSGSNVKPWYAWIELPFDAEMLIVYSIAGLLVGWLYFQWFVKSKATLK